jgi:hypothetical protein
VRLRSFACRANHAYVWIVIGFRRQLPDELGDEQAPVREDEDAGRAGSLHEAGGRDRLPGRRRMTEAIAAYGARIRADVGDDLLVELDVYVAVLGVVPVVAALVLLVLRQGLEPVRFLRLALVRGDERREHAGERVHLVAAQLGARSEMGRLLAEDPLEAEHKRVAHAPGVRRPVVTEGDLGEGVVEGAPTRSSRRERGRRLLAGMEERLARPPLGARGVRSQAIDLRGCRALV